MRLLTSTSGTCSSSLLLYPFLFVRYKVFSFLFPITEPLAQSAAEVAHHQLRSRNSFRLFWELASFPIVVKRLAGRFVAASPLSPSLPLSLPLSLLKLRPTRQCRNKISAAATVIGIIIERRQCHEQKARQTENGRHPAIRARLQEATIATKKHEK